MFDVPVFGITHPLNYDGSGGPLMIPICVSPDHPELIEPTQRAISTWNALTPIVENCIGCVLWEEEAPTTGRFHAQSAIVHELGHCAMGLAHPDRNWDSDNDDIYESTLAPPTTTRFNWST